MIELREGKRPWQVLLIGGASRVDITEVDNFQVVLERMTTPEQQPVVNYWRTQMEEALAMDDEQKLAFIIRLPQTLALPNRTVCLDNSRA